MASSVDKIPGDGDTTSKLASLEQRRCILLAIMGSTAPDNVGLKRSLERGLLTAVRLWLDEILSGKVGKLLVVSIDCVGAPSNSRFYRRWGRLAAFLAIEHQWAPSDKGHGKRLRPWKENWFHREAQNQRWHHERECHCRAG